MIKNLRILSGLEILFAREGDIVISFFNVSYPHTLHENREASEISLYDYRLNINENVYISTMNLLNNYTVSQSAIKVFSLTKEIFYMNEKELKKLDNCEFYILGKDYSLVPFYLEDKNNLYAYKSISDFLLSKLEFPYIIDKFNGIMEIDKYVRENRYTLHVKKNYMEDTIEQNFCRDIITNDNESLRDIKDIKEEIKRLKESITNLSNKLDRKIYKNLSIVYSEKDSIIINFKNDDIMTFFYNSIIQMCFDENYKEINFYKNFKLNLLAISEKDFKYSKFILDKLEKEDYSIYKIGNEGEVSGEDFYAPTILEFLIEGLHVSGESINKLLNEKNSYLKSINSLSECGKVYKKNEEILNEYEQNYSSYFN